MVAVANRRRLSGADVLGESSAAVANRWRLWGAGAAGEVAGADRDSSADWESSAIVANRRRLSGVVGTRRGVAAEWGIFGRSLWEDRRRGTRFVGRSWTSGSCSRLAAPRANRWLGAGLDGRAGIFGRRGESCTLFWSRCSRGNHRLGSKSSAAAMVRRCRSKFVGSARAWAGIFGLEGDSAISSGKLRRPEWESSALSTGCRSSVGRGVGRRNLWLRPGIVDLEMTLLLLRIFGPGRYSSTSDGRWCCSKHRNSASDSGRRSSTEFDAVSGGNLWLGRGPPIFGGKRCRFGQES